MTRYIKESKNIALPEFLFYFGNLKKLKSSSSFTAFDPINAVTNDPWQDSISPSDNPEKRTIILDSNSFARPVNISESLAFIVRMQNLGFKIYIKNKDSFIEIKDNLKEIAPLLSNLAMFNTELDYIALAQKKVARDKLIVLDFFNMNACEESFIKESLSKILIGDILKNKNIDLFFRLIEASKHTKYEDTACKLLSDYKKEDLSVTSICNLIKVFKNHKNEKEIEFLFQDEEWLKSKIRDIKDLTLLLKTLNGSIYKNKANVLLEDEEFLNKKIQNKNDALSLIDVLLPLNIEKTMFTLVDKLNLLEKCPPQDLTERPLFLYLFNDNPNYYDYIRNLITERPESLSINEIGILINIDNSKFDNELNALLKDEEFILNKVQNVDELCYIIEILRYTDCQYIIPHLLSKDFLIKKIKSTEDIKSLSRLLDLNFIYSSFGYRNLYELAQKNLCEEFLYGMPIKYFVEFSDIDFAIKLSDQNQTYLYLKDLNFDVLAKISSAQEKFQNIVSIRIGKIADISLLDNLSKICPKLLSIALPIEDKDQIKKLQTKLNLIVESCDTEQEIEIEKKNRKIFIEKNHSLKNKGISTEDGDATFEMIQSGEILNADIDDPQIRISVVNHNISENLSESKYVANKVISTVGNTKFYDSDGYSDKISDLRDAKIEDGVYYQFSLDLPANSSSVRLFSASANDQFIAASFLSKTNKELKDSKKKFRIVKKEDDFFYCERILFDKKSAKIVYTVRADKDIKSYKSLPEDNVARAVIDEYLSFDGEKLPLPSYLEYQNSFTREYLFSQFKEELKKELKKLHQDWLKEVFNTRSGSCAHKVAAVEFALYEKGFDKEKVRVVGINGNHVILEIEHNRQWYQADVGGGDNYKEIFLEEQDQYKQNTASLSKENYQKLENNRVKAVIERKFKILDLVDEEQDLINKIEQNKKILIVTNKETSSANFLLAHAAKSNIPIFYIDSPQKINFLEQNIFLQKTGSVVTPTVKPNGSLADFLQAANADQSRQYVLMINWKNFDSKQRNALNTLLDKEGSINGVKIANSIKIISLIDQKPRDISFVSRHNECFELDLQEISEVEEVSEDQEMSEDSEQLKIGLEESIEVDLQGFDNWKKYLFGRIILEDNRMKWQKSSFVGELEKGGNNFEIANISDNAFKELEYEFNQAKALGKISYQGYEINIPQNFVITKSEKSFDFPKFEDCQVASQVTFDQIPEDAVIINSYLFDLLLYQKSVENGVYSEELGLIAQAAKTQDKTLKIFISSNLSIGQFYCLLNQAQEDGVKLTLYLAPNVTLPDKFKKKDVTNDDAEEEVQDDSLGKRKINFGERVSNKKQKLSQNIIISNNANETAKSIKDDKFAIIDIEDLSYQEIIGDIEFTTTKDGFENFRKVESELIKKLREGKKIILKGHFSSGLLQMLHPLLAGESPFEKIAKNLTLIIEDQEITETQSIYKPLSFLPNSAYKIKEEKISVDKKMQIYQEKMDNNSDLINSEEESKKFIKEREDKFIEMLRQNPMLQLLGDSGVGKSRLLRIFENQKKHGNEFQVYREMNYFEDWANDRSDKTKILFIDESNIEDTHFTTFSPLKNDGNKRVYHKGKFYDLNETHKVVFARNSREYGGGRVEQKLFENDDIAQMHLNNFPASYIYEKLLKKVIYDKLSEEIKEKILEEQFKTKCQELIENFQKVNSKNKGLAEAITVRELQEQVLEYLVDSIDKGKSKEGEDKIKTPNFISTNATKEAELILDRTIKIRKYQGTEQFPSKAVGMNGVLFKGSSGVGKSEMISAILKKNDILDVTKIQKEERKAGQQLYYKIDANLPLEEKKKLITEAIKEGEEKGCLIIFWIDELNSCIDDGLEKILNLALTGFNPDGGRKRSKNSQVMLVASVNEVSEEGRSEISPALLHRLLSIDVKGLQSYEIDDLKEIVSAWVSGVNTNDHPKFAILKQDGNLTEIIKDFQSLIKSQDGKDINLRMFRDSLPEIIEEYKPHNSIGNIDFKGISTNKNLSQECNISTLSIY